MAFVFDTTDPAPRDISVKLGDSDFTLIVGRPTLEQRLIDESHALDAAVTGRVSSSYKPRFMNRLQSISGWRNVSDQSGNPVEFSYTALLKLLNKYPAIVSQIGDALAVGFHIEQSDSQSAQPN